jgi:hypothetical protein
MQARMATMVVLLAVTAAPTRGAILGVRWVDQPANPIKQVTQSPSVHTVEVWLELLDGESTSGMFDNLTKVIPDVSLTDFRAVPDGWEASGLLGPLDGVRQFVYSSISSEEILFGPGEFTLGEFDLTISAPLDGSNREFALTCQDPAFPQGVYNQTAGRYRWDARYNTQYSGYIAYGDYGNPGWSRVGQGGEIGQPTPKPLILQLAPEPTSLLLLAFGGYALVRKRDRSPACLGAVTAPGV